MVRLRVHQLLADRRMTRYRLAKLARIPLTSAYRVARPDGRFQRIDAALIDRLCKVLDCVPGELFTYDG
jgi:DNA-binding Xre family transcriptional regulator